jgi:hypothetical protein
LLPGTGGTKTSSGTGGPDQLSREFVENEQPLAGCPKETDKRTKNTPVKNIKEEGNFMI